MSRQLKSLRILLIPQVRNCVSKTLILGISTTGASLIDYMLYNLYYRLFVGLIAYGVQLVTSIPFFVNCLAFSRKMHNYTPTRVENVAGSGVAKIEMPGPGLTWVFNFLINISI